MTALATDDPIYERLLRASQNQQRELPYPLDEGALRALDALIAEGAATMRRESRTDDADLDLAERNLAALLGKVGSRARLTSSGEAVVVADEFDSLQPSARWWPFV